MCVYIYIYVYTHILECTIAPEANGYEFQSGGVIEMLEKLNDKFMNIHIYIYIVTVCVHVTYIYIYTYIHAYKWYMCNV